MQKKQPNDTTKLTVAISKKARIRLEKMKLYFRAKGIAFQKTTPGKLLECLITDPEALKVLKKHFNE